MTKADLLRRLRAAERLSRYRKKHNKLYEDKLRAEGREAAYRNAIDLVALLTERESVK